MEVGEVSTLAAKFDALRVEIEEKRHQSARMSEGCARCGHDETAHPPDRGDCIRCSSESAGDNCYWGYDYSVSIGGRAEPRSQFRPAYVAPKGEGGT